MLVLKGLELPSLFRSYFRIVVIFASSSSASLSSSPFASSAWSLSSSVVAFVVAVVLLLLRCRPRRVRLHRVRFGLVFVDLCRHTVCEHYQ